MKYFKSSVWIPLVISKHALVIVVGSLLREYLEENELNGRDACVLFALSAFSALVSMSVRANDEKERALFFSQSVVSKAVKEKNKFADLDGVFAEISKEFVKKKRTMVTITSCGFLSTAVSLLIFYVRESDRRTSLWLGLYFVGVIVREIYEQRRYYVIFVHLLFGTSNNNKFSERYSSLNDDDEDEASLVLPPVAISALAKVPGEQIFIIGEYRKQLFERIVEGTNQIIKHPDPLMPNFSSNELASGMVYLEKFPWLCCPKDDVKNNILVFAKEDNNDDDSQERLRRKIKNGLTALTTSPGLKIANNNNNRNSKKSDGKRKVKRELHIFNVGVLHVVIGASRSSNNNDDEINIGRALVSKSHFVFFQDPNISIVSSEKIQRNILASRTCVFSTDNFLLLKRETKIALANKKGGNCSFIGTFGSLLSEQTSFNEFSKTLLLSSQPAREERDDDENIYHSEPVAKIETTCKRLYYFVLSATMNNNKKQKAATAKTNSRSEALYTILISPSLTIGCFLLVLFTNIREDESTAFVIGVFAPLLLFVLIDQTFTKIWIRSIVRERKALSKVFAFAVKINAGGGAIKYSGVIQRFKDALAEVVDEYCVESLITIKTLFIVKCIVILSFLLLMISSHMSFIELRDENYLLEEDDERTTRAALTFFALMISRELMGSLFESSARHAVSINEPMINNSSKKKRDAVLLKRSQSTSALC
jgi:hypothetical protein